MTNGFENKVETEKSKFGTYLVAISALAFCLFTGGCALTQEIIAARTTAMDYELGIEHQEKIDFQSEIKLDKNGYVVFPNGVGTEIDKAEMERFGLESDLGILCVSCKFKYWPETKTYTQTLWWEGAENVCAVYPSENLQEIYSKISEPGAYEKTERHAK